MGNPKNFEVMKENPKVNVCGSGKRGTQEEEEE